MKTFLLAMTMLFLFANTTYANLMTFFGEDSGNPPPNTRLTSHDNADQARNDFFSNLSGVGTEDFEGFAPGTTPTNIGFPGAGTATFTGFARVENLPTGTNVGRYPISGNQYLDFLGFANVGFSQQISAFGFYGTDIGEFDGQVTLETFSGGTSTNLITIPTSPENPPVTVIYYGFITDSPFDKVVFGNTGGQGDFFGFDDFTIGTTEQVVGDSPVPEPATVFLVSFGLIGLGAFRRKFKGKN